MGFESPKNKELTPQPIESFGEASEHALHDHLQFHKNREKLFESSGSVEEAAEERNIIEEIESELKQRKQNKAA